MTVRCKNCRLVYERQTVAEVMAKALVDESAIQENCPACKSNAFTLEAAGEGNQQ